MGHLYNDQRLATNQHTLLLQNRLASYFNRRSKIGRLAFALLLGFSMGAECAFAAEDFSTNPRYYALFEAMQAAPGDPVKSFDFVQEAIKVGDLRGAISALERMLLHNPTLANIQLELGALYLRVGAADLASQYISQSLQSTEVPPWVRSRATGLLSQAKKASSRHAFSGSFLLGMTHDNNANAGPSSRLVKVFGDDWLLNEEDTGTADTSTELIASLRHIFDLNSQAGHQLESSLSAYQRKYRDYSDKDVISVNASVGPRFYFGAVLNPSWSLQPFVKGSQLKLDGEKYLETAGLGVNIRKSFSTSLMADLTLQGEDQRYSDSDDHPNSSNRSGKSSSIQTGISYIARPSTLISFSLIGSVRDSEKGFESLQSAGIRLSLTETYRAPFGLGRLPWRFTLGINSLQTDYKEADIAVDPDKKREETRNSVSLSNSFPLGKFGSLVLSTQYTDNDASLPNYDYYNWGGSLAWAYNF